MKGCIKRIVSINKDIVCYWCIRIDANTSDIRSINTIFSKRDIWTNVHAIRREITL